jgi:transcriptional regulator with XRE-family HTH domain
MMKTFGQKIKDIRKEKGMTQQEVADKMKNHDRSRLARLELGQLRITAIDLADIADALGVKITAFYEAE